MNNVIAAPVVKSAVAAIATDYAFKANITPGGIECAVHSGKLLIAIPREPQLLPSKGSGKTLIVAKTNSFERTMARVGDEPVKAQVTAYVPLGTVEPADLPTGDVEFMVPKAGSMPKVLVTKEMLIIAVDHTEPRPSSTGKMMLISPVGGAIKIAALGTVLTVNINAGFNAPKE